MPGDTCIVCGHTRCCKEPTVHFHRFPTDPLVQSQRLHLLNLEKSKVQAFSKICSKHFSGGDTKQEPHLALGKLFASPGKLWTTRAKRARAKEENEEAQQLAEQLSSSSRSTTPIPSSTLPTPCSSILPLSVAAGEQLDINYQVIELPSEN